MSLHHFLVTIYSLCLIMRMRKVLASKLFFVIFLFIVIIFVITFNYLTREYANQYLTLLPSSNFQPEDVLIDYHRLLNLTDFQYLLENNRCQNHDKELLALLIITSYVGHDELRSAHRQAVSQTKLIELGMQRVFMLAAIPESEHFIKQNQLKNEQERFGDLLQGNFLEAYRNLSYKHIMGLRWAATNCSKAKFIIKLDDDIIYDIFYLRRYLETLEMLQNSKNSHELLAGFVLNGVTPIRNVANKWFVSQREYPLAIYPDYMSGWLYITNAQTALRLVQEAHRAPFFWIDDTWVTGVLRARLRIPLKRLNTWYSANSQFLECCVRDLVKFNYECEYYVGPNGGQTKLLIEFQHNVEKCYFDECIKRPPEKKLNLTCVTEAQHKIPEHGQGMAREIKIRR